MRKRLYLICASIFLSLTFAHAQVPEKKEKFELFLLVGQSNMAGRGALTDKDRAPVKGILIFAQEDKWVNKGEPVHFDKPKIAGVGLGFTFAKQVVKNDREITVGLIPCAVGGTGVYTWRPGGRHFEEAVRRAKIAQEYGEIKAILWHQGESHSGDKRVAESYSQYLTTIMDGFRQELDLPEVPIIVGELGEFLTQRVSKDGKPRIFYVDELNQEVRKFAETYPNAAFVTAEGLGHVGDLLHFDAEAQKNLGKRYYEAYKSLAK